MATYYVDPDSGNNANNGLTEATAWETLTYANSNSTTGDEIIVVDGSYSDNYNGLPFNESRTYRAQTKGGVIYTGTSPSHTGVWGLTSGTTVIDGFRFDTFGGSGSTHSNILGTVTVTNCILDGWGVVNGRHCFGQALNSELNLTNCLLLNMINVTGNGNALVRHVNTATTNIRRCTSHHGEIVSGGKGYLFTQTTSTVLVDKCIFYTDSTTYGYNILQTTCPDSTYTNNIRYAAGAAGINRGGFTTVTNEIEQDPLFVDIANEDFTPTPDSIALEITA